MKNQTLNLTSSHQNPLDTLSVASEHLCLSISINTIDRRSNGSFFFCLSSAAYFTTCSFYYVKSEFLFEGIFVSVFLRCLDKLLVIKHRVPLRGCQCGK